MVSSRRTTNRSSLAPSRRCDVIVLDQYIAREPQCVNPRVELCVRQNKLVELDRFIRRVVRAFDDELGLERLGRDAG